MRKVDKLSDFDFLGKKIILPALRFAKERQWITANEEAILQLTAGMGVAKASDFKALMKGLSDAQRTYQIKKLVERKLLLPISPGSRQYTIGFSNNYLVRGVIRALTNEGFVPDSLNEVKN